MTGGRCPRDRWKACVWDRLRCELSLQEKDFRDRAERVDPGGKRHVLGDATGTRRATTDGCRRALRGMPSAVVDAATAFSTVRTEFVRLTTSPSRDRPGADRERPKAMARHARACRGSGARRSRDATCSTKSSPITRPRVTGTAFPIRRPNLAKLTG